jgi:hypothetical protein
MKTLKIKCGLMFAAVLLVAAVPVYFAYAAPKETVIEDVRYQCSMHPWIVSDKPENCPICGMKLTRAGERAESSSDVMISPARQQMIGVRTAPAGKRKLTVTLHTVGHAGYDPDFYNMLQEYKEIISMQRTYERRQLAKTREEAESLLDLIKLKLRLAGLSEEQIRWLIVYGQSTENLVLPADAGWVYADIYEQDSLLIQPGMSVKMMATAIPGGVIRGTVRSADEILYAMSRTVRVRIEVPNGSKILKPGMTLHTEIEAEIGESMAVPEGAVLHAGMKAYVFVDKGEGRLEPREVETGYQADGYDQILSGLSEGERVVTSANFLIDSESNLQAALKTFQADPGAGNAAGGEVHRH